MEEFSIKSFIKSNNLNQEITVKYGENVVEKIKTLNTREILEIDNKCRRAKKVSWIILNIDGIEYYFVIYIEDPLSKLEVSIDFYTIDKQYWEVDKDVSKIKSSISASTLISSNPKNWGLSMMILQIAKWGELKNDPVVKRNYYAYALWLLNENLEGSLQDSFREEILNHPSISYLSLFKDFALEERKFCKKLWEHCEDIRYFHNSNYIWFFLQYSYFFSWQKPLSIHPEDYLTGLGKNAKSYKRLIGKENLRSYIRQKNRVYQDQVAWRFLVIDEHNFKDENKEDIDYVLRTDSRYFFREYLLSVAYDHIYTTAHFKPNPFLQNTRDYLDKIIQLTQDLKKYC